MAANVKVFASDLEESAQAQVDELAALPPFSDAKIRIMPDAHAGKGCVIGFTADVTDAVIPNIVGVDIGCGILAVRLEADADEALARILDAAAHTAVPVGMSVHSKQTIERARLDALECSKQLKGTSRLLRSIGTLGGGNHFIECDVDPEGRPWLVIHSGSRNIGKQVADIYQAEAIAEHKGNSKRQKDELIERLKEEGRADEIGPTLAALSANAATGESDVPADLCWLSGASRDAYLHDMGLCQELACENRARIADELIEATGLSAASERVESVHNYIDLEHGVIRKGATSAYEGESLIVPLNMAAGCIMGTGLGNEDWNYSAPHGAGRAMSRMAARRDIELDDFLLAMEGIFTTTACAQTLDESPQAYKDPETILTETQPTLNIDWVMRPIWNFKAVDAPRDWKAEKRKKREQREESADDAQRD